MERLKEFIKSRSIDTRKGLSKRFAMELIEVIPTSEVIYILEMYEKGELDAYWDKQSNH